jgi:hypothetical protein
MKPPHKLQESWLDKQVRDLIGDGDVSHLPNAGQKFDWSVLEDPNAPADMRLAYKIMKDNNIAPEWILLGQELSESHDKIVKMAKKFTESYHTRIQEAHRKGSSIMARDAEKRYQESIQRLKDAIDEYNKKLLTYNILKPPQIDQRVPLNLQDLLK